MDILKDSRTYIVLCLAVAYLVLAQIVVKEFFYTQDYVSSKINTIAAEEMTSDFRLEQEINLRAKISSIKIALSESDSPGGEGSFEIKISNGCMSYSELMHVPSGETVFLQTISLPEPIMGPAVLEIRGIDGDADNSPRILLTEQALFGGLRINGSSLQHNMVLEVKTSFIPQIAVIRLILVVAAFVIFSIAVFCIYHEFRNKEIFLFFLSVGFIVLFISIKYPQLTFEAEPYLEAVSNFYQQTVERGIKGSFFVEDAGYWPLFQRLLSYFFIRVLRLGHQSVFYMQYFAVLFVACVYSFFILPCYKNYFTSNIRFLISIFLGTAVWTLHFEVLTFINFAYVGIFLIFYLFLLDFSKLTKWQYCLVLLSCVITVSKVYFLILIPMLILVLFINARNNHRRVKGYCILLLSVGLMQTVYTGYQAIFNNAYGAKNGPPIFDRLVNSFSIAIYDFVQVFESIFLPVNGKKSFGLGMNILFLGIAAFIVLLCMLKIQKTKSGVILAALSGAFLCSCINAFIMYKNRKISWLEIESSSLGRRNFFAFAGIIIASIFFVYVFIRPQKKNLVISILLCILTFHSVTYEKGYGVPIEQQCNWNSYSEMFDEGNFGIMIDNTRFILRNSEILYYGLDKYKDTDYWNYTYGSTPIQAIDPSVSSIHEITFQDNEVISDRDIIAIYAGKYGVAQPDDIFAVFYDKEGNEIGRYSPLPARERVWLGFHIKPSVTGVYRVRFEDRSGTPVEVRPQVYFAVKAQQAAQTPA